MTLAMTIFSASIHTNNDHLLQTQFHMSFKLTNRHIQDTRTKQQDQRNNINKQLQPNHTI